jgi:hypothetical protein
MRFETVEIKDLGKVKGVVPATIHYHEDQQVHLRIIEDEGNASAEEQEDYFNEIGGLGAGSATFKFYGHVMFQLRNKYTIIKKPF